MDSKESTAGKARDQQDKESRVVLEKAKDDNVKFVEMQFTDLMGTVKSTTIPVERLGEILEKGIWFDGSSIEGFARICESDMILVPDISTYAVLPWKQKDKATARFICDVHRPDNTPYESDPRYILRSVIREAEDMGFAFKVGPELEFFLFRHESNNGHGFSTKPVTHDTAGYFDFSPKDLASDVRSDIMLALEELGIEVEMSHHEVAPGQHEIDFRYGDALATADRAITLKNTIKSIAYSHDLHATFMPKPIFGQNGSGMHVHQSLFDINTGKNVFFDPGSETKLSKTAEHFIAGQLKHVKEMCAVIAPTVNSYKRLVPSYDAPVYICWAQINRSSLIRIPRYSPGREQSTRAELRCPDPSCNPYLAFAVMLKAGLEGIKNKLELPDSVDDDVYGFDNEIREKMAIDTLPGSLGQAIDEMKKGSIVRKAFGEDTFRKYLMVKAREWDNYQIQVTPWEQKEYFAVL
ncbi:type I glutamate--ammonia ligase [Candidatus Woesearchaeota archaeon]|nr:type I glutamate--ammonia ligase [Candidatus Woesearchaeota archaeon]